MPSTRNNEGLARRDPLHDRERQLTRTGGTSTRQSQGGVGRKSHVEDDEDRIGPYLIGEEIGRGSFATVYKGERYDNGAAVAIKSVIRSKLTTKLLENLESEISILKRITHRNIVELKDCLKTDTHIYLVMDLCTAGDLALYIRKRGDLPSLEASNQGLLPERSSSRELDPKKVLYPHPKEGGLNETIVRCFLDQLVDALRFLRAQNVIHRDIKPQNLLLQPASAEDLAAGHPPGIPVLKVADFGFARWLPSQSMAETLCGSPLYMAPEILRYEKYDAKADLWSVGAVLFEMSVGKPPFRAQNHVELLRKIERGEDKIKFPDEKKLEEGSDKTPTKVSPDIKALIRRLLKRKPLERMSFEDFFAESVLVAAAGSAAHLSPASSVSARHDAKTSATQPPTVPRAVARQGPPIVPPSSVASAASTARGDETTSTRASGSPAGAPPPPSSATITRIQTAPTPSPAPSTHSRIHSYGDQEPPPFARRGSTAASPPLVAGSAQGSAPPVRRTASYTPRYGSSAAEIDRAAAPTPPASDAPKIRDYGLGIQRAVSRQQSIDSTVETTTTTPPSAIERFNSSNSRSVNESMEGSNDSVLGKDYVVVEKRTVEINALADELANLPKRESTIARRPSRAFMSRPVSSMGEANVATSSSPPSSYPVTTDPSTTPPFAIPRTAQPTPHHPYSISSSPRPLSFLSSSPRSIPAIERFPGSPLALVGSPSAALAKAFSNLSSLKLFGSPTDGILVRRRSARKPIPRSMTPAAVDPEEERVLADLEDIAQKALVLFEFADTKVLQILPPTPSSSTSLGTPSYFSHLAAREQAASNPFSAIPTSPSMRRGSSSSSDRPLVMASSAKAEVLAAEALLLYLKALAFLGKGIERARRFWASRPSDSAAASTDFNEAVQWFRQRFNECFDKADFAKNRSQEEIPDSAAFAEKLVYDRALELSRAAAVNELRGENPGDCETAYETALWLLYALLDETMSAQDGGQSSEDRTTVNRFVSSIRARLEALRKKIAVPQTSSSSATVSSTSTPVPSTS
ncbi:serine/threonine protein kinase ATG1 [Sporobolomyces salmoneus]|uniref:serine/threonine protein kinase ATG1 n=1 Tax=Sporobolomyces salmoneus TaxID=183962 RepID=UPI00317BF3FC